MIRGIAKIDSISVRNHKLIDLDESNSIPLKFTAAKQIDSRCILEQPITIEYKGCKRSTHLAEFKIEITRNQQSHATLAVGIEYVRKTDNNSVVNFDLNAILTLRVSEVEFENIENKIDGKLSISIYGRPEKEFKFDSEFESEWEIVELEDLAFTYRIGNLPKSDWLEESLRAHNAKFLNPLSLKHRGHVPEIINELAQSAAEAELVFDKYDSRLEVICEIIPELRTALREWKADPRSNDSYDNLWANSPEEFKSVIADFDKAEKTKLEDQYDTLWGNFEASTAIKFGENNYGASKYGFEPNPQELEWIGERYLQLSPLRSKTLEKILINSLLYIETISFARQIKTNETPLESTAPTRLNVDKEKDASYLGLAKTLGSGLWTTTKHFGTELIKVAITFGIATLLTSENVTASWVITTGYTLFRWWRRIHFLNNEPIVKQTLLLQKMINVQQLANKQTYNANYTRETLSKASDEGAIFSPLVFSILDRQIKLDS
jgi:hypothetical protein